MTGTFSIVGAGRLGTSLAAALVRLGWRLALIVDTDRRAAAEAKRIVGAGRTAVSFGRTSKPGDVVFVTVPDDSVATAAAALARSGADWTGRTVLHTSGLLPSRVLGPLRAKGARTASLHPVQTFPRKDTPAAAFRGITWGVEGDADAVRTAETIVRALGGNLLLIAEPVKPLYHAACALASNALVALEGTAAGLLGRAGIGEKAALAILLPLAQGTLRNVKELGLEKALTGPIKRGDAATVRKHLAALGADPGARKVYKVLGRRLVELAEKGGRPPGKVRTLRRLLEGR